MISRPCLGLQTWLALSAEEDDLLLPASSPPALSSATAARGGGGGGGGGEGGEAGSHELESKVQKVSSSSSSLSSSTAITAASLAAVSRSTPALRIVSRCATLKRYIRHPALAQLLDVQRCRRDRILVITEHAESTLASHREYLQVSHHQRTQQVDEDDVEENEDKEEEELKANEMLQSVLLDTAQGLAALHAQGLRHRQLHMGCVLLYTHHHQQQQQNSKKKNSKNNSKKKKKNSKKKKKKSKKKIDDGAAAASAAAAGTTTFDTSTHLGEMAPPPATIRLRAKVTGWALAALAADDVGFKIGANLLLAPETVLAGPPPPPAAGRKYPINAVKLAAADVWSFGVMMMQLIRRSDPVPAMPRPGSFAREIAELALMKQGKAPFLRKHHTATDQVESVLQCSQCRKECVISKGAAYVPSGDLCLTCWLDPSTLPQKSPMVQLALSCLQFDPAKRPIASALADHPFFADEHRRRMSWRQQPGNDLNEWRTSGEFPGSSSGLGFHSAPNAMPLACPAAIARSEAAQWSTDDTFSHVRCICGQNLSMQQMYALWCASKHARLSSARRLEHIALENALFDPTPTIANLPPIIFRVKGALVYNSLQRTSSHAGASRFLTVSLGQVREAICTQQASLQFHLQQLLLDDCTRWFGSSSVDEDSQNNLPAASDQDSFIASAPSVALSSLSNEAPVVKAAYRALAELDSRSASPIAPADIDLHVLALRLLAFEELIPFSSALSRDIVRLARQPLLLAKGALLLNSASPPTIPMVLRDRLWPVMLGVDQDAVPANYTAIDKESACSEEHQLEIDIRRCHQYHPLLSTPSGHAKFRRVIKSWLSSNPNLAYWQGVDSVAAPFIVQYFDNEAMAFACLDAFIRRHLIEYFQKDNSAVLACHLSLLVQMTCYHDPVLAKRLARMSFRPELYAIPWFFTLFAHILSIEQVSVIWDTLLVLPPTSGFPVFLAFSLLRSLRSKLLSSDFSGCLTATAETGAVDIGSVLRSALDLWRDTPPSFVKNYSMTPHERVRGPPSDNDELLVAPALGIEELLRLANLPNQEKLVQQPGEQKRWQPDERIMVVQITEDDRRRGSLPAGSQSAKMSSESLSNSVQMTPIRRRRPDSAKSSDDSDGFDDGPELELDLEWPGAILIDRSEISGNLDDLCARARAKSVEMTIILARSDHAARDLSRRMILSGVPHVCVLRGGLFAIATSPYLLRISTQTFSRGGSSSN